jgi:hypothetical protein
VSPGRARSFVVPLVAALAAWGCGLLIGADEYAVASGGAAGTEAEGPGGAPADSGEVRCGGYRYTPDPSCDACVPRECCEELAACRAEPECGPYEACISECRPEDADCHATCAAALTRSTAAMANVFRCKARCPGCLRPTEVGARVGGASCGECLQRLCADSIAAYEDCPECVEAEACVIEQNLHPAPNPAKIAECGSTFDSALSPARRDFLLCTLGCATECGLGQALDCVGDYTYRPYSQTSAVIRALVADDVGLVAPNLLSGASVRACRLQDVTCDAPLAGPVVAGDGEAEIMVPFTGFWGFNGYLDVTLADGTVSLYRVPQPIGKALSLFVPGLPLLTLAAGVDWPPAPGLGAAVLVVYDCVGGVLLNGSVETDSGTVWHYTPSGFARTLAAEGMTFAWLADVAPGLIEVSVKSPNGRLTHRTQLPIRAGAQTYAPMFPLPQ